MLFPKDIPDPDDATRVGRMAIVDGRGKEIVRDVVDEAWRDRIITAFNAAPSPESRKAAQFFEILHGAQKAGKGWYASSQIRQLETAVAQDAEITRLKAALRKIMAREQTFIGVREGDPSRDLPSAAIAREALEGEPS